MINMDMLMYTAAIVAVIWLFGFNSNGDWIDFGALRHESP